MKALALLAALVVAMPAAGQEMVTVNTRPGVTQSFFIANMGQVKPEAIALLFIGGEGSIRLRKEDGQIKFGQGNFLPRSRREFIRNGVLPVVLDSPSDHPNGMSDEFRMSDTHRLDVRAVLDEMKKRHSELPVFLIGTSRGTLSAAYLGAGLGGEVRGVALTSSYFQMGGGGGGGRRPRPVLSGYNWSKIRVPLLFVHHADDLCHATPYSEARRAAGQQYPLVTVHGGKPAESGPCEPLAAHGFFGKEAETVDAIAGWMLGKNFRRNIE